jgi:hypothetical protein
MQSVLYWMFAKSLALQRELLPPDPRLAKIRGLLSLEKCLVAAGLLIMSGVGVAFYSLLYWYGLDFGRIDDGAVIKAVCTASFLIGIGCQLGFSSFFIYLLDEGRPPSMRSPDALDNASRSDL